VNQQLAAIQNQTKEKRELMLQDIEAIGLELRQKLSTVQTDLTGQQAEIVQKWKAFRIGIC
jgi:hypothetical protein